MAGRRVGRRQAAALRERRVWLFSSGPLDRSAEESEIPPTRQVAKIAEGVGAEGHATFGGCLRDDAPGWLAGRMVANGQGGDFRNLDQVRAWGKEIAATVTAGDA